ncbi:xylan 1,4-beta-xylosidase [Nonomuraea sp. B12E4]|uniref:xylan 1,4-beta-xylosidase n=1 Tax=Nonomuraea sp. B12E4 TaxID=3153564 RepID=UPI00325DB854
MGSTNGRSKRRRLGRLTASAAAVAAMVLAMASCGNVGAEEPETPPRTSAAPQSAARSELVRPPEVEPGWPRWGFTHTGTSANNITERFEHDVADSLARTPMLQNQHIMGFGALNPEPYRGRFFWEDLDSRLNLMQESDATAVITLCCAPDWMKGGPEGETEDSAWDEHLEDAPYPEHFDDFARLAAEVATKYQDVKYFMVWNEFKGFWKDHSKPADYKGYTQMYNKVYEAVKKARPDAQVGGPYIGFDSNQNGESELRGPWGVVNQNVLDAFEYWFKHKKGADFVVVDGASPTDAHELLPDEFGALQKFSDVTKWLRNKVGDLPVWWSEYYFEPEDGTTQWSAEKILAVQAAAMMEFAKSGAATALYWNPQEKEGPCPGCMWDQQTGGPTATGELIASFTRWFPADARIEAVTSSDPRVRVLAQPEQLLLVNTSDSAVTTSVDGEDFQLQPYEIRWSDR